MQDRRLDIAPLDEAGQVSLLPSPGRRSANGGQAVLACEDNLAFMERVRQLRAGSLKTRPMGKPVYDPALQNGSMEVYNAYSR